MDTSFTTNDEEAAVALSNLNLLGGASAEQLLPDGDIEDGLSTSIDNLYGSSMYDGEDELPVSQQLKASQKAFLQLHVKSYKLPTGESVAAIPWRQLKCFITKTCCAEQLAVLKKGNGVRRQVVGGQSAKFLESALIYTQGFKADTICLTI